jgi:protein transport protein SEC31
MENLKMGKGCVSATQIHSGVSVGSIEFNPHKKNLLASGGSEVLIQDISANIKAPSVFKPGVPNYHEGSRITSISWNRIVPHILASASENGKIVVWDLKVNKSIFNFTEPTSGGGLDDYFGSGETQKTPQSKETQMMWNPEIPTQFVVANDDDKNPSINIWDLRSPDYPVATFNDIHYSGILSFSWCLSDPSLVVSSGKDNRTVITNFKTGE